MSYGSYGFEPLPARINMSGAPEVSHMHWQHLAIQLTLQVYACMHASILHYIASIRLFIIVRYCC